MKLSTNRGVTGSSVGALGTAGEMSTLAIAVRITSASKLSRRRWDETFTLRFDGRLAAMVAKNATKPQRQTLLSCTNPQTKVSSRLDETAPHSLQRKVTETSA